MKTNPLRLSKHQRQSLQMPWSDLLRDSAKLTTHLQYLDVEVVGTMQESPYLLPFYHTDPREAVIHDTLTDFVELCIVVRMIICRGASRIALLPELSCAQVGKRLLGRGIAQGRDII